MCLGYNNCKTPNLVSPSFSKGIVPCKCLQPYIPRNGRSRRMSNRPKLKPIHRRQPGKTLHLIASAIRRRNLPKTRPEQLSYRRNRVGRKLDTIRTHELSSWEKGRLGYSGHRLKGRGSRGTKSQSELNDVGGRYMTVFAQAKNGAAIAFVIAPTSLALDRDAASCTIETGLRWTIDACAVARRHPTASDITRFLDRIWECGSKAHKESDG